MGGHVHPVLHQNAGMVIENHKNKVVARDVTT
jgi:hypothetical protein